MKEKNIHEGCIEQMDRLYKEKMFGSQGVVLEEDGMIHMDDWEMRQDVQEAVMEIWKKIDSSNLLELSDVEGYWDDFYHMFGFKIECVDYTADVEV